MRNASVRLQWLGLILTAILVVATNAAAQYGTANIVGTVHDSSGAVIPKASVTVTESSKGYVRHLVTGSTGSYAINSVPIGTYTITFEAKGFIKVVQTGITLTTGQTQRVNAVMKVGAVTQQVTVQGNLPHVQTETASMSNVITGQQISQLEINGRNFVRLALLVPGATPVGLQTDTVGVMANNNISFNGSRTQYNNWTIDGAPNTDEGSASTFNTYPNLDSIAEFRISTSNYGAEYGHHSGAQIDVVTKSGTSNFHGTVSEYLRNDVLDAQNWFTNRNWAGNPGRPPRAPLKQNEYGFTVGGPFFIPGFYNNKKNKTFFFWSEDWRKIRGSSVLQSWVPSMQERQGDFSQCDPGSLNYNATVAKDCVLPTLNGVTYDNVNSIPLSQVLNTTAAGLAQAKINAAGFLNAYFPLPNQGANPTGWTVSAPAATNWREDQVRVDQNIGDKMRVFVRFTHDSWNTLSVPTLWGWSSYDTVTTPFDGPGKSAVVNITNNFTPNLMNEFIAGYTEDWITLNNKAGGNSTGITRASQSGFSLGHFFPANAGNPLLPGIAVCGGGPCIYEAAFGANPWTNSNPIVDFQDNMTWVHGNHIMKWGAYIEDYHKNETFGGPPQGDIHFWTGQPGSTGNALADMFIGQVSDYNEGTQTFSGIPVGGNPKGHWQYWDFEPYFQDNWHVTSNLTLNLGMRYYLLQHIRDISKPTVDSGFIPSMYNLANEAQYNADGNLVQGTGALPTAFGNGLVECGSGGIPPGCQYNTFKNFAPRFGFAYRLGQNTSIRGGYGIFYEIGNGNESQSEGGEGNPPVNLGLTAYNMSEQQIGPIFSNGIYSAPIPPAGYTNWPTHQKWPSEQQFSLSLERQIGNDNLFSVAYAGMLGRHLAMGYQSNWVPTGMGTVNVPQLAGATGNDGNQYCDASGNCDVQNLLIHSSGYGIFFQPYRGYSGIATKSNVAVSNYNSLQASFRHTMGHGLTAQVSYTWARGLDDSSSTYTNSNGNWTEVEPSNFRRFYGTSDLSRTQVFTASYIYNLPFFKQNGNWLVRGALGGWEVSGITSFFTGTPINILCGRNNFSTGIGGNVMCNTVGNLTVQKGTYNDPTYGPTPTWFNPGVIAQPNLNQLYANGEPGMFGYLGRNVISGPGTNDTDLALIKNWKVPQFGEGGAIQFRWETFNSFNHPNFTGFNAGCSGKDNFGETCNNPANDLGTNANGEINSAGPPRIMQFGLKIQF